MPQKNSFAICLFSTALGLAAPLRAAPQPTDVMPAPADAAVSPGRVEASGHLSVTFARAAGPRLRAAVERAMGRWDARARGAGASATAPRTDVLVDCSEPGARVPSASDDESYELHVRGGRVLIGAANDFGAMHGLETLLQLRQRDGKGWYLPVAEIRDRPRFAWRGLMIDVARHWQPTDVIERNLDAMAVVKLNVLHLHLTDDQGFRIESLDPPRAAGKGLRRPILHAGPDALDHRLCGHARDPGRARVRRPGPRDKLGGLASRAGEPAEAPTGSSASGACSTPCWTRLTRRPTRSWVTSWARWPPFSPTGSSTSAATRTMGSSGTPIPRYRPTSGTIT